MGVLSSVQTPANISLSKIFHDLKAVLFIGHLCFNVCRKRYSEAATSSLPRFECGIQVEDCRRENHVQTSPDARAISGEESIGELYRNSFHERTVRVDYLISSRRANRIDTFLIACTRVRHDRLPLKSTFPFIKCFTCIVLILDLRTFWSVTNNFNVHNCQFYRRLAWPCKVRPLLKW